MQNKKDTLLKISDLVVSYRTEEGKVSAVNGVSLEVKKGEIIAIIGPSGSGKSTIFKLITGLEESSQGEISINEVQYPNRLGRVGYMPQQDLLMPWRTIIENAALPLEIKGMKKLLLGPFLVGDKLDIIHKEDVGSPVAVPEFNILIIPDGIDKVVCKFFRSAIHNPCSGIISQYIVTYGMHQMSFAKAYPTVNK